MLQGHYNKQMERKEEFGILNRFVDVHFSPIECLSIVPGGTRSQEDLEVSLSNFYNSLMKSIR
jgi:hypothetical protein